MSIGRSTNLLLAISNLFFLLLYITLCVNNRIAVDDFYFLSNVSEHGIIDGAILEYNSWNSRWLSLLLNHSILFIYQKMNFSIALYGILNLILFVLAVFFLITTVLDYINISPILKKNKLHFQLSLLNYSVFFVGLIFISTMRIGETWFWICSSTGYIWSNIMFILGIGSLLKREGKSSLSIIGCLSFFFIGGSSPTLSLLSILILSTIIILASINYFQDLINKKIIIKRSLLSLLFCLSSFIILYLGEGNRIREQFFDEISIGYSIILNFKMAGIIILKRIPLIIPFIAILSLPIIAYSNNLKKGESDMNWKKKIIYLSILYLSLIYFFQLPITYKTQDVGAYRTLFFITILTIVYFLILFFLIGKNLSISKRLLNYVSIIPLLISSFIFAYFLINQYYTTTKYAKAYDQRMINLKEELHDIEILDLKPLPPSGMLYSAEISSDTSHYSNKFIKKALNLNYKVRKSKLLNNQNK